jgi:hypothetical protein
MIGDIESDHHAFTGENKIVIVAEIETKVFAPTCRRNSGSAMSAKSIGVHQLKASFCAIVAAGRILGQIESIALMESIQLSGSGKTKLLSEFASGDWKSVPPDLSTPIFHGVERRYSSERIPRASPRSGLVSVRLEILWA